MHPLMETNDGIPFRNHLSASSTFPIKKTLEASPHQRWDEKGRRGMSVAAFRSGKLHRQFDIKPYAYIQVFLFLVLTVLLQLFGDMSSKKCLSLRKE